ncbi:disease resistance-like protein DSC1 isoform X2 [Juglans regia]|nr:disease resistance-like protein DSC1 isoform X2 [Juglans regia]
MLNTPSHEAQLNSNAFSNMKKLGLLKIYNVYLPAGLRYLSNELRLMEWHEYPLTSIPNNFQPDNLVELIMPRCRFEQLPKGFSNLNKLKVLDLSNSQNLIKTPDFTGFSNLQRLILQGCTRLYKVHPSIRVLNRLVLLNLKDCQSLASLPYEINLESLKTFFLSGCSSLIKFPEIGENMKRLSELYLDKTAIEEVPLSIQNLTGLTLLNLSGCKNHPSESWHWLFYLSALTSLVALDLSDCNLSDGAIPGDLSGLSSLESLILSRNNFTCLPDSISQLSKLKFLYLDNCSKLKLLPSLPFSGEVVMARQCSSLENCSNQVIVLQTSYETELTIINCLSSGDDEKSKVSLLDKHFHPLRWEYQEEPIQHGKGFLSSLPVTLIPKWFYNQALGSSVSIPLPPGLSKNTSWKGIALYTVFEVEKILGNDSPCQKSHNIHELIYDFDMQDGADLEDCTIILHPPKDQSGVDLYRLCLYISHARFRDQLDRRSCISPSISTNSPSVRFKACGARILYEHDMVEFIDVLRQKGRGFRNSPSPPRALEVVKRRFPRTERVQDFDGSSVYNLCFYGSIQTLFPRSIICKDPSLTFDSPSYWYKVDGSWLGLALCASFSVGGHSSTSIVANNYHLTLSLKTDEDSLERFQITYCLTEEDLKLLRREHKLEWLCYMPRRSFPDWLNGCPFIEASIATDYPGLRMQQCGFRLLFQHDAMFQEVVQTLDACPDERQLITKFLEL